MLPKRGEGHYDICDILSVATRRMSAWPSRIACHMWRSAFHAKVDIRGRVRARGRVVLNTEIKVANAAWRRAELPRCNGSCVTLCSFLPHLFFLAHLLRIRKKQIRIRLKKKRKRLGDDMSCSPHSTNKREVAARAFPVTTGTLCSRSARARLFYFFIWFSATRNISEPAGPSAAPNCWTKTSGYCSRRDCASSDAASGGRSKKRTADTTAGLRQFCYFPSQSMSAQSSEVRLR